MLSPFLKRSLTATSKQPYVLEVRSTYLQRAASKPNKELEEFRQYCKDKGWAIEPGYISTVDNKPTGYILHNITMKEVAAELAEKFGATKDAKQYKGQVNFHSDKGTLIQVALEKRGLVISMMQRSIF